MSVKQQSVSMPMASAGIIGFSSDMKIEGLEVEPKIILAATLIFVLIVKIATVLAAK